MASETLDLAVGEGDKVVALEEVKDTLTQEIHDDTDVAPEVEAVAKMDAPVPVLIVVCLKSGEYSKFDSRCISVLLDRPDDFDSDRPVSSTVSGLDNFAERPLTE